MDAPAMQPGALIFAGALAKATGEIAMVACA
jgi:hypothetical protein